MLYIRLCVYNTAASGSRDANRDECEAKLQYPRGVYIRERAYAYDVLFFLSTSRASFSSRQPSSCIGTRGVDSLKTNSRVVAGLRKK